MCSVSVWLLSLILCWGLLSPHTTLSYAVVQYYVTPHSPNPDCPLGRDCFTINEYAQGNYFNGGSGMEAILNFMDGEHNLTAQNLIIYDMHHFTLVGPYQGEAVIRLLNDTSIQMSDIYLAGIRGLKFISHNINNNECISTLDIGVTYGHAIGFLDINDVFIESCQLSLQKVVNAFISRLSMRESSLIVLLNYNGTISIGASDFCYSSLNISDSIAEDLIVSAMSLQGSLMNNSLITVDLEKQISFQLSILDTYVVSQDNSNSMTGIDIDIRTAPETEIYILVQNCTVMGNHHGLLLLGQVYSLVELAVDQCYIANNGYDSDAGGIQVYSPNAMVSITSSVLSENKNGQLLVEGVANVTVFNCTLRGAYKPLYGFGALFQPAGHDMSVILSQTTIENNAYGVIFSSFGPFSETWYTCTARISGTNIMRNQNGIVLEDYHKDYFYKPIRYSIFVEKSCFQENTQVSLGVIDLQAVSTELSNIALNNVTFFNNTNLILNSGIVQVDENIHLDIENSCTFRGNQGTPVYAHMTTVTLSGEVIFADNVAYQAGAISLISSLLRVQSIDKTNTNIVFVNNVAAITGGGVYVDQLENIDSYSGSGCFYEVEGVTIEELINSTVDITLVFSNNTAINGGMDIYGATPNSRCNIGLGTDNEVVSSALRDIIYQTSSNLSSISSDPKRVCLCDSSSQLMCANLSHIFYETTRYPGEVFPLSLALVGFEFGTVTGPIYANLLPHANSAKSSIGDDQYVRRVTYNECAQLNFTVNSFNSHETVILSSNDTLIKDTVNPLAISSAIDTFNKDQYHVIPLALLTVPVYIEVTLDDCPPGFKRVNPGRCECNEVLKEFSDNKCSIYDHKPLITPRPDQWIAPDFDSDKVIIGRPCPHNYCKHPTTELDLNNPDEQCDLGRTGILCGACPENFSLAIGSSRCIVCTNYYDTLLLLAFAAAGIALVFLIKILDLTVTTATINGLIFYANIVWANQSVLFPPQSQMSLQLQILKTFIAWLNLDLGIQTCFIPGLDGYWTAWLQFAFSAYIWFIAGMIILISHYSTRATRLFGNNSVSVLATLFLLSYAKLLFTILLVLEFGVITIYPDNITEIVWLFDGNVPYFSVKHSILLAVAIAILLVLWLPYTFVLLFIQCLRRQSHRALLRWVNRLTPFFDSYLGPLKDKHHYWIGLGLLARLGLILTSAVTSATVGQFVSTAVLLVTITVLSLLVLSVYKRWQLSLLESAFLVNLAIFSSGALVIEIQGGSKDTFACVSLGISFALFLGIVGFQVWRRLDSLIRKRMNIHHGYEDINIIIRPQRPPTPQQRPTKESNCDLRESLLADTEI